MINRRNESIPGFNYLGFRVYEHSAEQLAHSIFSDTAPALEHPVVVSCLNPHSMIVSRRDSCFRDALYNASILIPDGQGIIVGARILCDIGIRRFTGYDLFVALNNAANQSNGTGVFFLGSTDKVLQEIEKRFKVDYSEQLFRGSFSPPLRDSFTQEEQNDMVDRINSSGADLLWVGMTAPKQEKWVERNKARLNVRVIGSIGAVFDFYAGTVKRPGRFWRENGLEWLPRLVGEPRRLWKRNLVSTPLFLGWVLKRYIATRIK